MNNYDTHVVLDHIDQLLRLTGSYTIKVLLPVIYFNEINQCYIYLVGAMNEESLHQYQNTSVTKRPL